QSPQHILADKPGRAGEKDFHAEILNACFLQSLEPQRQPRSRFHTKYDKNFVPLMSLRVARGVYNPEKERFHYYVSFKPTLDPTEEERAVEGSHSVEVAISVTETGELADLAFSLPQTCRNHQSLEYLKRTHSATLVDEKVFITVPGLNGDSVLQGKGTLELDAAGRIMGLEIN
ncbi:MAG TPA: hypothetical protein VGP65_07080, partial [Candidatus Angelobacter sp.]|nr:hypothetical protein [Candidatus Angelobacter sp.]